MVGNKTESEIRREYESRKRIEEIREATKKLADLVNSSLVTTDEVSQGWAFVHSYLFNTILVGALKNVQYRKGDGRLLPQIHKASKEIWG